MRYSIIFTLFNVLFFSSTMSRSDFPAPSSTEPKLVCRFFQLFLFSGESHLANFNFSSRNKTSRKFSPDFYFFRRNYTFSKFGKKSQFLEKGGGAYPISNNGRRNIISRTTFDSDLTVHLSPLFFLIKNRCWYLCIYDN